MADHTGTPGMDKVSGIFNVKFEMDPAEMQRFLLSRTRFSGGKGAKPKTDRKTLLDRAQGAFDDALENITYSFVEAQTKPNPEYVAGQNVTMDDNFKAWVDQLSTKVTKKMDFTIGNDDEPVVTLDKKASATMTVDFKNYLESLNTGEAVVDILPEMSLPIMGAKPNTRVCDIVDPGLLIKVQNSVNTYLSMFLTLIVAVKGGLNENRFWILCDPEKYEVQDKEFYLYVSMAGLTVEGRKGGLQLLLATSISSFLDYGGDTAVTSFCDMIKQPITRNRKYAFSKAVHLDGFPDNQVKTHKRSMNEIMEAMKLDDRANVKLNIPFFVEEVADDKKGDSGDKPEA